MDPAYKKKSIFFQKTKFYQFKTPDVEVGFVLEVPKSYLKEKAGITYQGYGDVGENWYQNSMDGLSGLGDLSIHFFK